MKYSYTNAQFKEAVKNSLSVAQVAQTLGIKPADGNYVTIKNKIKELNLDTSHFTGREWNVGNRYKPVKQAQPLSEIFGKSLNFYKYISFKRAYFKSRFKTK